MAWLVTTPNFEPYYQLCLIIFCHLHWELLDCSYLCYLMGGDWGLNDWFCNTCLHIVLGHYNTPFAHGILDSFQSCSHFSVLVLQVRMDEGSKQKTTVITCVGFFQFHVKVFGLRNTAAWFHDSWSIFYRVSLGKCVLFTLNCFHHHQANVRNIQKVFSKLCKAGLQPEH